MISIVIIGKNEATNLPKLYDSLKAITIQKEIIYIDSASTDESIAISLEFCSKVFKIEDSPYLCAAAGRYVGTKEAKYEWILYLDGDMELEDEFIAFLNNKVFLDYKKNIAGFTGYYNYLYKDGTDDKNRLLQAKDKVVDHFGGAVMLQRRIVLDAGNWNPSVVANEEIDLYIRIQNLGYRVFGLDKKFVRHIAKKESNIKTLISLFVPQNRRFYGFGQVLVSQFKHRTLARFILKRPFPFLIMAILLLLPFSINSIYFLLFLVFYISFTKKWHYNLVYTSDMLRGLCGVFKYSNYRPKYRQLESKELSLRDGT